MHDLELLMRNYGVSLDIANKHLSDQRLEEKYKKAALEDLDKRAKDLIVNIYCLANSLKLTNIRPLHRIISEKYGEEINKYKEEPAATSTLFSPYLIQKAEKKKIAMTLLDGDMLETLYKSYFNFRKEQGYVRLIAFPQQKPAKRTSKKKTL